MFCRIATGRQEQTTSSRINRRSHLQKLPDPTVKVFETKPLTYSSRSIKGGSWQLAEGWTSLVKISGLLTPTQVTADRSATNASMQNACFVSIFWVWMIESDLLPRQSARLNCFLFEARFSFVSRAFPVGLFRENSPLDNLIRSRDSLWSSGFSLWKTKSFANEA